MPPFAPVFEHSLSVAPVVLATVLAGILPAGLAVLFVGVQNLLPVRRIIFSSLVQDFSPVPEVTETANDSATGLAARAEAVPGPLTAVVLGQGLALVAVGEVEKAMIW